MLVYSSWKIKFTRSINSGYLNHSFSADEEAERKKKKKIRMVGQQLRQAQGSHGFDSVERVKKTNAGFKQHTPAIQPRITPKDSFNMDMKQVYI